MEARILILIINFHAADEVVAMVDSARSLTSLPTIVVIDNSLETSNVLLHLDYPAEYLYTASPRNLGYFGAAAHYLTDDVLSDFDWCFVANPDILFEDPHVFEYLSRDGVRGYDGTVGLYGPSINSSSRKMDQNPHRIRRPSKLDVLKHVALTSWTGFAGIYRYRERLSATRGHRTDTSSGRPREVFAVQGSFIGFHRRFFDECHLPTDNFLFWEEEIVALQADDNKLRTIYDPRVSIRHAEHKSMKDPYRADMFKLRHHSARVMYRYLCKSAAARSR